MHALPSQQGCPGPPQAAQLLQSQVWPAAVQKSLAAPPPWQHCRPAPPQPEHEPPTQVPAPAPQEVAVATQVVPAQQLVPEQVELAQQSWPVAPHGTKPPRPLQTTPPSLEPAGMQRFVVVSRQPPPAHRPPAHAAWSGPPQGAQVLLVHASAVPVHVLPAQQGWPRPPQPAHWPVPVQRSPVRHAVPGARQELLPPTSQQPPVQLAPAQHGWPTPPHCWQTWFRHKVPVPHTSPGQHA